MQTLEIALLQPNTIWHDPQGNQELITEHLDNIQKDVQLIVLPETWATGFIRWHQNKSQKFQMAYQYYGCKTRQKPIRQRFAVV